MASHNKHVAGAAKAVRRQARRAVANDTHPPRYGIVRDTSPLKVELTTSHHILDDEDISLSQWVRYYDKAYGIEVDDRLLLIPMGDGDWLATDVDSDTDL